MNPRMIAHGLRWAELQALERAGSINCLQRDVMFVLAPAVSICGERHARRAIQYLAEFTYREHGAQIVEDWKAPEVQASWAFHLNQHLMKSVLGLEIRLTGS